jgi:hypothetical protein
MSLLIVYGELLAPRPTPTLEEHLLSSVHDYLSRGKPEGYRLLGIDTRIV